MAAGRNESYLLARNKAESDRLAEQHHLAVRNLGFLIHPKVQKRLPPGSRIADVAAGTGIWALQVAEQLPDVDEIVAYDISSEQFPAQTAPPVTYVIADAKQMFPAEDYGTFDLVHVRAVYGALQPADWDVVMRNIVQLLKPGGTVQWTEADVSRMRCLRDTSNTDCTPYHAMPRLLEKWEDAMGSRLSDAATLLPKAARAHLKDVEVDWTSSDREPELRAPITRMCAKALLGFAEKAEIWTAEELADVREGIATDIANGESLKDLKGLMIDKMLIVAQ